MAAQNPDKVAALQKRANELAASMVKSPLLQAEFGAMLKRLGAPPALPGEDFDFSQEPEVPAAAPRPVVKTKKT